MTPNHSEGNNEVPRRSDEVAYPKLELGGLDPLGFELADSVDTLTWQRLVDDRLSDEQYRDLLLAMEATPTLWRECALAFLEEQALTKCFSSLRSSPKAKRKDSEGVPAQVNSARVNSTPVAPAQGNALANDALANDALAQDRLGRKSSHWQVLVPILAVAAGVVFTFFAFNGIWREMPVDETGANSTSIIMDRESFRDYLAELSADQRHELFERSSDQAVGMPIQSQPVSLSPGRAGGQRRFVFYRTSDGRQIIVPVDDYQYVTHDFQ
ncbi:MAG: hypothetical protein Q8M16_21205 [Pirellulaceae bacterium]|nr:hypothetical protein [Pirellulaceae bacterium]